MGTATSVQILCVEKTPRTHPHKRVEHIGGVLDGVAWKLSHHQAIIGVEQGTWDFFLSRGDTTLRVVVAHYNGHKYLKTEQDGIQPEGLLRLGDCRR